MTGSGKTSLGADAPRRVPRHARERGLALLVVLWIVASAALIVSAFNAAVKSGVSFVNSEVQLARTDALLDAGAEIAAARLIDEDKTRQWAPYGGVHTVSFAGATLAIAITDASGRIDLNKADKTLIMGLLRQFMSSEAKAAQLCDRILLARGDVPGAQENPQLQDGFNTDSAKPKRPQSEVPAFLDVAQLRTLEGMTPELYRKIAPFLTVYSSDGRINPLAAPNEVLMSIPQITRSDIETLRTAARAPRQNDADNANQDNEASNSALDDIASRAGAYLVKKRGPAFIVTVEVLKPGGKPGDSCVYVLAPGLDKDAPYRLIAKRPSVSGALSGAV